jgi:glycine/serine hydroxymethyltransferase
MDRKELRAIYGLSINDFAIRMEKSNLIIDAVGRLGTCELTRMGMKEKDLGELADLFVEAARGRNVRKKVKVLRDRFEMDFRFR